jgi:hypothetical protein
VLGPPEIQDRRIDSLIIVPKELRGGGGVRYGQFDSVERGHADQARPPGQTLDQTWRRASKRRLHTCTCLVSCSEIPLIGISRIVRVPCSFDSTVDRD